MPVVAGLFHGFKGVLWYQKRYKRTGFAGCSMGSAWGSRLPSVVLKCCITTHFGLRGVSLRVVSECRLARALAGACTSSFRYSQNASTPAFGVLPKRKHSASVVPGPYTGEQGRNGELRKPLGTAATGGTPINPKRGPATVRLFRAMMPTRGTKPGRFSKGCKFGGRRSWPASAVGHWLRASRIALSGLAVVRPGGKR